MKVCDIQYPPPPLFLSPVNPVMDVACKTGSKVLNKFAEYDTSLDTSTLSLPIGWLHSTYVIPVAGRSYKVIL